MLSISVMKYRQGDYHTFADLCNGIQKVFFLLVAVLRAKDVGIRAQSCACQNIQHTTSTTICFVFIWICSSLLIFALITQIAKALNKLIIVLLVSFTASDGNLIIIFEYWLQ